MEKSAHTIAQRWWRTLGDEVTPTSAQASLDALCVRLDGRQRTRDGHADHGRCARRRRGAAAAAGAVPGRAATRADSHDAGAGRRSAATQYSMPPGHAGEVVTVRHKLGTATLDVIDRQRGVAGPPPCVTPTAPAPLCAWTSMWRALTKVVLANFSDREPCRRKTRRPPTEAALAEAQRITQGPAPVIVGEQVVIDFAAYADQARPIIGGAQRRRALTSDAGVDELEPMTSTEAADLPAAARAPGRPQTRRGGRALTTVLDAAREDRTSR